jgi:hypothetical protein
VSLSDHARANRSAWGAMAADYASPGRRHWADKEIGSRRTYVTPGWARRWPSAEIWVARLASAQERASAVA